jgi:hypothetical protein
MKQGVTRLRVPEAVTANLAEAPALAPLDPTAPLRAIPVDLRPVISAYRRRGRFMLRIENLPQLARFSAGQNNGNCTWSLQLDELEELIYFAPKTPHDDHTLSIRLIAKDETEAFTIALIDFPIRGSDSAGFLPSPASQRASAAAEAAQDELRTEALALKSALAAREAELNQLRASAERMSVMLQQKLDAAVSDAQAAWKHEEAARLGAETARLQEQFERKLMEKELRAQAVTDIAREQQSAALRLLRQEFTATKESLTARENELSSSRAQLERLRKDWETEIASAKASAETRQAKTLKEAEAEWRAQADKIKADLIARCEAAERAAADKSAAGAEHQAELGRVRAEVERQRKQSEADLLAATAAAEAKAAEALKTAEAEWQAQADKIKADLTARCEAAERATDGKADADGRAELNRLRAELEQRRKQSEVEIAAIKAAAESTAAAALKAAETEWRTQTDKIAADLTARCESAELAAAKATDSGEGREAELNGLRTELERLRKESAAQIMFAKAAAEAKAAETQKAAEAEWQVQTNKIAAELMARCEAVERMAAGKADASADLQAELTQLRTLLERQRKDCEVQIQSAKAASEIETDERLKAAEAQWQKESAVALAQMATRYEALETSLASARKTIATDAEDDSYVRALEREIKTLRATLVDREAAIVQANALQDQVRLGTVRDGPGTRWQPLSNRAQLGSEESPDGDKSTHQMIRDIAIVVVAAAALVIAFPRLEAMLPDSARVQIDTMGGLFAPATPEAAAPPPVRVASTQAKAVHPLMYAMRSINVRAEPSMSAAIATSLKRGAAVAILEKRDSWDRVEVSGSQQQGWVFGSYLTDTDPGQTAPVAAKTDPVSPVQQQTTPAASAAPTTAAAPTASAAPAAPMAPAAQASEPASQEPVSAPTQ